jgi:flagellar motor protein MotB
MTRRVPRWAISLADLVMLMLGFFVLLHAAGESTMVRAARSAFPGAVVDSILLESRAELLFDPREARLRAPARIRLHRLGAAAARAEHSLLVVSHGIDRSGARLDAWELAAARTAAIARELSESGLGEDRVQIALSQATTDGGEDGQHVTVERR